MSKLDDRNKLDNKLGNKLDKNDELETEDNDVEAHLLGDSDRESNLGDSNLGDSERNRLD